MTLPANIRVNVIASFPTRVQGSGPITVTKANGIWTIGWSLAVFAPAQNPPLANYPTDFLVVYDSVANTYFKMSLSSFVAAVTSVYRIVTAAGDVTVVPSDVTILMQKTVGAATNINAGTSASRLGVPLTIKDYKGDAFTNKITFVPSAGETIDGLSAAAAITAGIALIDTNFGKRTYYPLVSGGGYT
jgi:hypothetical protein